MAAGMRITGVFVFPADTKLAPVSSLPPRIRDELGAKEGDFAITRVMSRNKSKIVDANMANLLKEFGDGNTIIEALVRYCDKEDRDPNEALEAAYPILEKLIVSGFLVPEGSEESEPVETSLSVGEIWAGFEIVKPVQVLQDSEVYQGLADDRSLVALKIMRDADNRGDASMINREAAILRHLDGGVSPRLIMEGRHEERPFLASEWIDGIDSARAAAHLRSVYSKQGRQRLLDYCCNILGAYTFLHDKNVIHGDVHPGNIIVDEEGGVRLIDFGYSRLVSGEDTASRRGTGVARAFTSSRNTRKLQFQAKRPQATFAGEQHVVAHLLYRLITGHHFVRFSAEQDECMRQIEESKPATFAEWGVAPWPDVEAALAKALSPEPGDRYDSIGRLHAALRDADIPRPQLRQALAASPVEARFSDALLKDYIRRFDPTEKVFETGLPESPMSSINYGSGGVAYFLYRLSFAREDARLLSWAKLWIEKAIREAGTLGEKAFTKVGGEITRDVIGRVAIYHTETGLYLTKALIAHSMGDYRSQIDGIRHFVKATETPCGSIDVTLGLSGILIGTRYSGTLCPPWDT